MGNFGFIFCPHLKDSTEGSVCAVTGRMIKDMEDVTLKLCMGRHYEACYVYMQSLQNMVEYGSYSHFIIADMKQKS